MNLLLNFAEATIPHAAWITFGAVSIIIFLVWYQYRKIHASDIASLATTAGIFFTFLGIVLALGALPNQEDVQQKINSLLGGIFIAFIPSIVGAFIAASTHVCPDFWRKPVNVGDEQETDIDAQILQELKRLNANIVGNSETSLTTRLEKFQLKVTENQDALRKEFRDFADNVAKNIIEALRQSMNDLNEKLGEQFGANFAKFANVIPKLLEWQEQYRATIENTQKQLTTQSNHLNGLLESLDRARESFTGIAEHVGKIADSSNVIDNTASKIATSLTQAADGMTQIKANAEQFQKAAESLTANIAQQTESAVEQKAALEQSAASLKEIAEKTVILNDTAQQLDRHIQTMSTGLGSVGRLSDTLQGKAESIEKNMSDITNRTLTQLAGNLLGISKALVDDYSAIQKIIRKIRDMDP